jgi:hypothetical protein
VSNGREVTLAERRQRQLAAVTTGLYVRASSGKRLRDRKVGRLVHRMRQAMPWLTDADEPARAWAQLEVSAVRSTPSFAPAASSMARASLGGC